MIKAVINFSGYADGDLGPTAQGCHDGLLANPIPFTTPIPTLAVLLTQINSYTGALATARTAPSQANTLTKNNARVALQSTLSLLGNYVNSIAQGDPVIITLSGFPSYNTIPGPIPSVRPAPQYLVLKQGTASGSFGVSFTPYMSNDSQQVQTSLTDPGIDANSTQAAILKNGSGTLTGFTPGVVVYVRVRSISPANVNGAWSDLSHLRVI